MKARVSKEGFFGSVWTFTATSRRAYRRMRHLFKGMWSGWTLYVEHRYETSVASALIADGFTLTRAEDDAQIEILGGHFVLKEKTTWPTLPLL
jgi:hypothetical protein